jgi:hypothetical protein
VCLARFFQVTWPCIFFSFDCKQKETQNKLFFLSYIDLMRALINLRLTKWIKCMKFNQAYKSFHYEKN